VYDAAAKTLDIYVNGRLDNGTLSGNVPDSQALPSVNTSIGMRSGGAHFQGTIDEVRIYNLALTAAQIHADMSRRVGAGAP
jgi:hypothetical protein